jgi:ATP-dependent Zn protease
VTIVVADTCSLVNFAAINRMDVVEATLRRRARWTQAVEYEVKCMSSRYPSLKTMVQGDWFGESMELDTLEDHCDGRGRLP